MSAYVERIRAGLVAPLVGEGADGARRSAVVVRDELATLAEDDPRRPEIEEQAAAWDAVAGTWEIVVRRGGTIP